MADMVDSLVQKALQSLAQDERDELVRGLLVERLTSGLLAPVATGDLPVAPTQAETGRERLMALLDVDVEARVTRMRVLPVRLPAADHTRLRRFCQASGFSMAVVIRALVERFLDQQTIEARGVG